MKILWVKPGKLLPLDSGGKLRTYNILRHLAVIHEVTYLSYYLGVEDEDYEREILRHVPGTISISSGKRESHGLTRLVEYLRRLPDSIPYSVSRFASSRVRRMIGDWMSQRRFDVVVCDFLASAPNFPQALPNPCVLFQHNVESVLWKRRAMFATRWADRVVASIESHKMSRYEPKQVRRFHHVLAVSETDRRAMSSMTDPARLSVVPTGVDLSLYKFDPQLRPAMPLVVFTGSMDWEPNIDGVEYFCREIWPLVLRRVPAARFRIVGRDPDPRVRRLACASVEVTGTVPAITDHLREAAALVVPLRMGGGTRLKIYEGMALGKATVSTSVGAEGLDVRHERDILLADDPAQFADYLVRILLDENLRRMYEASAAATAQRYDWSEIAKQFAAQLLAVARSS